MRLSHPALRYMHEATHEASRLLDRLQAEHRIRAAPETAPAAAASISSLVSVDKPSKRRLHAVARVAEFESALEDRAATLRDYLAL